MTVDVTSTLRLRGVTIPNRIMLSPMCQYQATDGLPNDWHFAHLAARAVGGCGVVMTEATAVVPEGRISPADTGIWNEAQGAAWARITSFIASQGAVPAIQLAHAGRKASCEPPWRGRGGIAEADGGWSVVAPSAIPFSDATIIPRAMTEADIDDVVAAFVAAANRAWTAGFRVAEIHAAHGYLLHSFLSPLSNRRDDEYGGSLENRMRFPLRVVGAVRTAWPADAPLFVRVSTTDWVAGGWDVDECAVFATALKEAGVDLLDCSSGGITPESGRQARLQEQVPIAGQLRGRVGMPVGAVGGITSEEQVRRILDDGMADLAVVGRHLLWHPYWPRELLASAGDGSWPASYAWPRP